MIDLDENLKRFMSFRWSLEKETDRGCALLAASFLEEELKNLLKKCFVKSNDIESKLFSFNGPLGTFSSKIEMAFFLSKINGKAREDLHLVRKIRNKFGHHPEYIDFETDFIKDRCSLLYNPYEGIRKTSRSAFIATMCSLHATIQAAEYNTKDLNECKTGYPLDHLTKEYRKKVYDIQLKMINKI